MRLPKNFVYLEEIDASILQEMKYFTNDNFIGRPIAGYKAPVCIITQQAAIALSKVQEQLKQQSLGLKIYDAYRPQTAVNDFIVWSKDVNDQKMKKLYYPNVDKQDFFILGYIAEKSTHSSGSAVDVTIIDLTNNNPWDMGTDFDFMDEQSHFLASNISPQAQQNRLFLKNIMEQAGFIPYEKEWWHFNLKDEPFPDTYFDFHII